MSFKKTIFPVSVSCHSGQDKEFAILIVFEE